MPAKSFKLFLLFLLQLAFVAEPIQAAEIDSLGEAINQAGRQRMLSQRMVKAYTQILLDADSYEARQQLDSAVSLFQAQLNALDDYASTREVETALDEVKTLWTPFKAAATESIDDRGLRRLVDLNEDLLAAAHRVVLRLEDLSSTPAGHLTNLAGRQRMLSQRIAKFYMLRAYGIRPEEATEGLREAAEQFRTALTELENAPQNTRNIDSELFLGKKHWSLLETTFASLDEGELVPVMVGIYCEKVLQLMNSVTGMYARLPSE